MAGIAFATGATRSECAAEWPERPAGLSPAVVRSLLPPGMEALVMRSRFVIPTLAGAALLLFPLFVTAQTEEAPTRFRLVDGRVSFFTRGPQVTRQAQGRFGAVTSRVVVDPQDLSTARGWVDVVLGSVTSADWSFDAMFRRAPFLSLAEFPRARFEVRRVRGATRLTPGAWTPVRLAGRLTVRGVTRPRFMRARILYSPRGDAENDREMIRLVTATGLRWDEFRINVPGGVTREVAGDGVRVIVDLTYRGRRGTPSS